MNETSSPGLMPLGGALSTSPDMLTPVGGGTTPSPAAPIPATAAPAPASRPPLSALYDTPNTAGASRFSTPAPAATPGQRPASKRAASDEEESLSPGKMIGSLAAGLIVGALCLLGWRWIWDNLHFNLSWIAIGVGFVIGFVMTAVAQKEHPFITISAGALSIGFSIAGVYTSLTSGRFGGIFFGIICIIVSAGAAIKAADSTMNDSND